MARWNIEIVESDEPPDEALRLIADHLNVVRRAKVYLSAPMTLTVEQERVPVWAVLVAILFFPIGLVTLWLARQISRVTIFAEPRGGGSRLTVDGEALRSLAPQIDEALSLVEKEIDQREAESDSYESG